MRVVFPGSGSRQDFRRQDLLRRVWSNFRPFDVYAIQILAENLDLTPYRHSVSLSIACASSYDWSLR